MGDVDVTDLLEDSEKSQLMGGRPELGSQQAELEVHFKCPPFTLKNGLVHSRTACPFSLQASEMPGELCSVVRKVFALENNPNFQEHNQKVWKVLVAFKFKMKLFLKAQLHLKFTKVQLHKITSKNSAHIVILIWVSGVPGPKPKIVLKQL